MLADQIKEGAANDLGVPSSVNSRPTSLIAPKVPPPPCSSPGPGAQQSSASLRSSVTSGLSGDKISASGRASPLPPAAAGPDTGTSLSADLRSVQASLDRVQGTDKEGGPVGATYNAERVLGSGAFGIVYQASIAETGEMVAIKKVLQDARFKNRELEIMQELNHPNIVELKSAFHVPGDKPKETYLNVVMEYCPETMHNLMSHYTKSRKAIPYDLVQIYTYHMLRGVAYLTAKNICHRDIKPPNVLITKDAHELKICDFGSAKRLAKGEPNVAYICSRYYRAPELIFGATDYSTLIDMWSVACVTAEMILQQVLFPGDSGVDQLMEIIKVLGTPSPDDLNAMNPVYGEFKFPQIKSYPWNKIFRSRTTPEAVAWLSVVLQYDPKKRPNGLQACMHKFFDDLRSPHFKTSTPVSMFWFSDEELALMTPEMRRGLIPDWVKIEQGGSVSTSRKLGILQRPTDLPASNPAATSSSASAPSSSPPPTSPDAPAAAASAGGLSLMPAVVEEGDKRRRSRRREDEKDHSKNGTDNGDHSPKVSARREKRKGRDRTGKAAEKEEATSPSSPAPPGSSSASAAQASESPDALADFTHAMKRAAESPETGNKAAGPHAIAPSSPPVQAVDGDSAKKAGVLAGAGALQLAPAAPNSTFVAK